MTKTAVVLVAGILAIPVWAQNVDDGDDPDHGVARISLMSGDVTVQRGDTGEAVAAELNAPLVALDHVLTGPSSRAEVQFDYANMIRLGPVSEVRIAELKDNDYFIQIAEGTTTFSILRDTNARVEISTPTVSVLPLEKGVYRITVRPDGGTEITVRSGQAEIHSPRGTEIVRSGKTMQARGTADNPDFMILSAISRDDWDHWNEDRDRELERSKSYQYVSRDIYGADDLDGNGRWVYDPPYGNVWVPNVNVNAGWAPYRVGRWVWVNYYGWTWVSSDPWGWAPYHYGSWYESSYGWAWYPGSYGSRYYWRPALVSFFGWGGGGIGIGIGGGFGYGNVGWVPLAPFEVYRPWYRRGVIINNYTVVNNTNIVNTYRNARQVNGVTSVQAGNFGRTRVGNDNYIRVNNTELARAGQVRGVVPAQQTGASRRFSDRNPGADVAARVNNGRDRQFATASVDRTRGGGAPSGVVNNNSVVDRGQGSRTQGNTQDRTGVTRGGDIRPIGGNTSNGRDTSAVNPGNANAGVNDNRSRRSVDYAPQSGGRNSSGQGNTPNNGGVSNGSRQSQPVQINPPIVRDRGNQPAQNTAPRAPAPSSPNYRSSPPPSAPPPAAAQSGGGGGGQRGTPAPSSGGGGGGKGGGDKGGGKGDGGRRR